MKFKLVTPTYTRYSLSDSSCGASSFSIAHTSNSTAKFSLGTLGARGLSNYELYKIQTGSNLTYEEWLEYEREQIALGINSGAISTELETRVADLEESTDGLTNGVDPLTYYILARDN